MSYSNVLEVVNKKLNEKESNEEYLAKITEEYNNLYADWLISQGAHKILSAVSDENTIKILDYITHTINETLSVIFKVDPMEIQLDKDLYNGVHPHINVTIRDAQGRERDLKNNQGDGIKQIISVLFLLCVIEVTNKRPFVILDELMRGLDSEAVKVMATIIQLFAEKGMQFVMINHNFPQLEGANTYVVSPQHGRPAKVDFLPWNGEVEDFNQ